MFAAKIQNSFGTYKFHPKRSADFVDSNIIRIFAEILSYSKKDQTRVL